MKMLLELAQRWRREADGLRGRYGLDGLSRLCITHAEELEETVDAWQNQPLDLRTAATESGYSVSQIRRLLGQKIENVGEEGIPRVRRGDLPRKPRRSIQNRSPGSTDVAGRARARARRAETGSRK